MMEENIEAIKRFIKNSHFIIMEDGYIGCKQRGTMVLKEMGRKSVNGYMVLTYAKKTMKVHRIIYQKFNGDLLPGHTINHKDGDKTNNHKDNLEQVTIQENLAHAYKIGLRKRNFVSKRKFDLTPKIKEFLNAGCIDSCVAKRFKTSPAMVKRVREE